MSDHNSFMYKVEKSALITIIGIFLLFSMAMAVVLIAPRYVDPTWTTPTNPYQVQIYEIADPHLYITSSPGNSERQQVYHIKQDFSLLAFQESETTRIVSPPSLEKFITHPHDSSLKLTSQLLFLRKPVQIAGSFDGVAAADTLRKSLQEQWHKTHPADQNVPYFEILELYQPNGTEGFAVASSEGILENWIDRNFIILDDTVKQKYHQDPGVIYVNNPQEFRIRAYNVSDGKGWRYDPNGEPIQDLKQLQSHALGFKSRQELIQLGEHIYAIEGCWYCHTDQTRTLVQDVVLNGSDSYPAPPSSANEYIYQRITFPGTRRIGPDLSRVAVKRPSRDWHKGHFWSPKTASKGSIMPAFQHFFDTDPRGTGKNQMGIPNYRFEAIFQYLMTKGTRITPPTQAWWLGKDPVKTKEIIEGQRTLKP